MPESIFHKRVNDLVCKILTSGERIDSIVVEGYDCVGKGRVVKALSNKLNIPIYRPDYSFLYPYLPREYRGIVNWSYFDIMRVVHPPATGIPDPVIFDRAMISASVYNKDPSLMEEFKKKTEGYNVVCILVVANLRDYKKFAEKRGVEYDYDKYTEYTGRFYEYLGGSGVEYLTFINPFEDDYIGELVGTCDDCRHYSFPNCLHKKIAAMKSPDSPICKYSLE